MDMDRNGARLRYKRWGLCTLGLVVLVLGCGITVTYVFDPFFQYHAPYDWVSYRLANEAYQNPGIARHFAYDSLITGTSMTQNFKPSWFAEMEGLDMVKLCYPGGYPRNFRIIIEEALAANPDVKRVYWGLDAARMMELPYDGIREGMPWYLYDTSVLNDVPYVLNKSVLTDFVAPVMLNTARRKPSTSFDAYGAWQDEFADTFGLHAVLERTPMRALEAPEETLDVDAFMKKTRENLTHNVLPVIRANPGVRFILFDPPYSIAYWYNVYVDGTLEANLAARAYMAEQLSACENVEYYVFTEPQIVGNLYAYKDNSHYSQDVNHFMAQCFREGRYRVPPENPTAPIAGLRDMVESFDFAMFDGESVPFLYEEDLAVYLGLIGDARYVVLAAGWFDAPVALHADIARGFDGLGLAPLLSGGYVAAASGGARLIEEASADGAEISLPLDGETARVISRREPDGPYVDILLSSLLPEDISYAENAPGLQIAVYDRERGRVVDNKVFPLGALGAAE